MSVLTNDCGVYDGDIFARIISAIRNTGYAIVDNALPLLSLQSLFMDIKNSSSELFHEAGIGREQDHHLNRFVRRDRVRWLERSHLPASFYFDWIEQLRQRINRELFLGLFDFECHYAHYPEGAFYKKHVDAFRDHPGRKLTVILYLNPDWQYKDGGELLLYNEDSLEVLQTISPVFGRLVVFLSEEFPHEVLPSNRSRYSLTGWFRINTTDSSTLDPPS